MKRIKQLDKNLINQIAAGEVIERPASVVKELVENSIDAGASKIEIEISNECRDFRIADNGSGIHKDDILLAFSRHATSKIAKEQDLWTIDTLGFRGEALASIISVAKVICTTRTKDDSTGVRVECHDSEVEYFETGCAQGTIMEVKELFYNTPVRLKFLKQEKTELSKIIETLQNIAIANPSVAITLKHKGHTSLKTTGSNDFASVISEVYSKDLIRELVPINKSDELSNLFADGYTSNPDFTRSNRNAVYLFVNGRAIKCPILIKAIDNAYRDMIPSGRYPFTVLSLTIPADQVDVNVHPSKRELRYINPNQIYNFVYSAVKSALESAAYKPKFQNQNYQTTTASEGNTLVSNSTSSQSFFRPSYSSGNTEKIDFASMKSVETDKVMDFYKPVEQAVLEFETPQKIEKTEQINIIGQYKNTYIILETEEGLQIIDQHIAHERTLYEKLKEQKTPTSQLLLMSDVIELEPSDISLLEEKETLLEQYGYKIEQVSEREIIFRKVPQYLAEKNPRDYIQDVLDAMHGTPDLIEENLIITTACHSAIKANQKLTHWQMEDIIKQWQKTKFPKTCPHGRKIAHTFTLKEVASFFGRVE